MATIITRGGEGYSIDHANGSGLNFFGANGAGYSIAVGEFNSRTYIGNANGTVQGAEIDNDKWANASGVIYGVSGAEYLIPQLPQDKATLNISFHNDTAVDVQNFEVRGVYDENNIDTAPSGSEIRLAEVIHPDITYTHTGSGDSFWTNASGAVGILELSDSPGSSALAAYSGTTEASTWADWYVCVSTSPTSVGAKTAKLYMSLEYL